MLLPAAPAQAQTKPAEPTGVTATAGDQQVTLTWDDPNDASITKYQVWHRPQAQRTGGSGWVDVPGGGTARSYTVTGLTNGTEYQFWLRAVNVNGAGTARIAFATPVPVPATEAPAKPRIHQVTTGIRRITIYLMPPNDPTIQKYQVGLSPNTQSFKDIPGSNADSSVLIVTVPENKAYDFTIRAVNSFGPGPWIFYRSVTPGFPTADGKTVHGVDVWGFTVTPGEGQLGLTWNARHPGVCGYVIEWRESTGTNTWGPWKRYDLGSWSRSPRHTITGLKKGTSYQVRVYVNSGYRSVPNGLAFGPTTATTGGSGQQQLAPEPETVSPPPAPDPLTASFANAPAEHKGTGRFTLQVAFSEAVKGSAKAAAKTIQVTGGTLARAWRAGGAADRWTLDVRPSGHGAVTVTLPATTDCSAAGAVCTADGRRLASAVSHTVQGPPGLSVADARGKERVNATIDFRVTLSRAAAHEVTVRYATRDGTAKKGKDYRKAKGTLTFAAGETAKTVAVEIIDDALNEDVESFRLLLYKPNGAYIADGEATGQVVNSDPMPDAWLARFGRTVASQAVDAVTDRLEGGGASHMTLGGQPVSLDSLQGRADAAAGVEAVAAALGAGPSDAADRDAWMRGERVAFSRTMTGRDLLLGSSFHLASKGDGDGPGLAAWGRVARGSFDGDADGLGLDGEVTTGFLGADVAGAGWLAGVALSRSRGEGSYRDHAVAEDHPDRGPGDVESTLTGVLPYARVALREGVTAWGMAGYGAGELVLTEKGETGTDRHTADLTMTLGAIGGRGTLVPAPEGGGFALALKTDAFWVRTQADAARSDAGNLAASDTDATRLRLALDASRAFALGGGTLTPSLEVGLRHDGGDAETGTGVEVGAGIRYEGDGIAVAGSARWLAAHEASGYEEWGASGSVRIDPGASGRGLSLTLAPTIGDAWGGAERLWSARDARALAPGAAFEAQGGLDAEVGYGLSLFGGRFTGTPHAGVSLSDGARAYRLGWRLNAALWGDPRFEIGLDATRGESANDDAPEHGAMLRAAIRW